MNMLTIITNMIIHIHIRMNTIMMNMNITTTTMNTIMDMLIPAIR